MVINRWIGAETIMVSIGETSSSLGLLRNVLLENTKIGTESVYQIASGTNYKPVVGLVFLTLPGYYDVFGLCGSASVIF